MNTLVALIKRNCKLFFKDKGMFFTSMVTPMILLILYVTFLGNVYRDSFADALPEGVTVADEVINGLVGGELFSSLLAVCCVTVAFCSNMLMVQDKVSGAGNDLMIAPVRPSILALGYYIASFFSTMIICLAAAAAGFLYLLNAGWYLRISDVFCILADVFLLVMFGTVLSSIVNFFLSSQGQISAVGTVISAGYGFICGAYMPISNFGEGLQKVLSFLPGTYGTSLIRNHSMQGVFHEMADTGFPAEVIEGIRDSVDCNLYFYGDKVGLSAMYLILGITVIVLLGVYMGMNRLAGSRRVK